MEKNFTIQFMYHLENSSIEILLTASVENNEKASHFFIHSIKVKERENQILPSFTIKKIKAKNGEIWVHIDSEKPTFLSEAVGKAIDYVLAKKMAS